MHFSDVKMTFYLVDYGKFYSMTVYHPTNHAQPPTQTTPLDHPKLHIIQSTQHQRLVEF